jgi:hypothetical protein
MPRSSFSELRSINGPLRWQLQATGTVQDLGVPLPGGRALAILDIVDGMSAYQLPIGSAGEAAIYTDHFREPAEAIVDKLRLSPRGPAPQHSEDCLASSHQFELSA